MDERELDFELHKYWSIFYFAAIVVLMIVTAYSIYAGVGVFHEPVQHNLTEHVVDKKIISHYKFMDTDIKYIVFTDAHKFEMDLKDYNQVHVGDSVRISLYDNDTAGYGYFNNDSFCYYSFGG